MIRNGIYDVNFSTVELSVRLCSVLTADSTTIKIKSDKNQHFLECASVFNIAVGEKIVYVVIVSYETSENWENLQFVLTV